MASAQTTTDALPDSRTQYPAFLSNSYFGLGAGSINYPFSGRQLESGFRVESVDVHHPAVRIVLFGHRFHKYLSAQVGYTRPVQWVSYNHLNGDDSSHSVRIAMGDVALKSQVPITSRVALYGEAGIAMVSQTGFTIDEAPVVAHKRFGAPLVGAGLEYSLNPTWDVVAGATFVRRIGQPIALGSLGFRYNMRPLPAERVQEARDAGFIFPKHLVQLSFVTNALGYGLNNAVSSKAPVFWGGDVQVARGATVRYQRNLFHTRSRLALDAGLSVSLLKSDSVGENFLAVSAYPLVRWTFLRTTAADVFLSYSIAGPSFVSRRIIDRNDTGSRFSFQDLMGIGMFVSRSRNIFVQLDISHYSNGNIFSQNPGIKIPATITLGRGF